MVPLLYGVVQAQEWFLCFEDTSFGDIMKHIMLIYVNIRS